MRKISLIVATLAAMVASGTLAAFVTLRLLMSFGIKYHNNYEHFGQTPLVLLVPILGLVGFAIPGVVAWRLHKNNWRVSLRSLMVAMTVLALLFSTVAILMRVSGTW